MLVNTLSTARLQTWGFHFSSRRYRQLFDPVDTAVVLRLLTEGVSGAAAFYIGLITAGAR